MPRTKVQIGNALLAVPAALIFFAVPAAAQDAPAAPATSLTTIETVVVTAERREQNSQDVPVALSAVSGDMLDKMGVIGFQDLGTRTPALRFGPGPTGGENYITLRGIGSQNTTSGGDSPVAYSVDGIYMARTTAVDPEFFDIERIEVLRGPQGTLYGRNSVGGSVNVITNKPTDELSGHVDAMLGDYNARTFRAWANVPLYQCGDCKILARITGVSAKHDAYQENLSQAPLATHNSDAQDFQMLRGQLLFQFNADVDLLLSGTTSTNKAPVATKTMWNLQPSRYIGQAFPTDPRQVYKDYPERMNQTSDILSATLNWDLGFAKLTAISGFTEGSWVQTTDSDGSDLAMAMTNYWTLDSTQYSQEVRLASTDSDINPLKWIGGLFYFHEEVGQTYEFVDNGLNSVIPGGDFIFRNGGTYKTTSYALFGQLDYDLGKITDESFPLTVSLGLRYTNDRKYGSDYLDYIIPSFAVNFPNGKTFDERWGQVTGKFGLSYKVTPDAMVYANVSRGYLSGGGLVGNYSGPKNGIYDPETAWSYEVGFKSQFMDNTLQFNASAYRTEIKKMQVFVQDILGSRVDNAGSATIEGAEFEAIFIPVEGLRLNAEVALTDARYDEYLTTDNRFSGGPVVSFAGNRLVQTPKHTVNLGAQYAFDTSVGTFTPRVDFFYSSELFFLSANNPLDRQKAYTKTNLRLTWEDIQRRWSIEAFVHNLEDKDVIANDGLNSITLTEFVIGADQYIYYPPRTVGVRFGVNF